jgi:hypothetical protein
MSIWDVSNPAKPKAIHDPNAILDYPIDYSAWLADAGSSYVSHEIVGLTGGITNPRSTQSAGKISVWIAGGTVGEIASFTVRITASGDGVIQRIDDKTFYLKIVNR